MSKPPKDNVVAFVPKIEMDIGARGAVMATIANLTKILNAYKIIPRYNVITKRIELSIPGRKFTQANRMKSALGVLISLMHENRMPSGNLMDFLVPLSDANQHNPIAEWIDSVPWDGESRLKEFYATIKAENEELKEIMLKKWLIMGAAAAFEDEGIEATGMLVLQGRQALGKTRWFKNLVPKDIGPFIKDGLALNLEDKDSILAANSFWLVELGELPHTIAQCGVDALKAFIGRKSDCIREPYGRASSDFPRKTVFCGTVNEARFLKDRTGNRRFFTIACEQINYKHEIDMQQLWAEAKVLYENGESYALDADEMEQLNAGNSEHEFVEPLKEKIMSFFHWEDFFTTSTPSLWLTTTEVLEMMNWRKIDASTATRAGIILKELTYGKAQNSSKGRRWGMPDRAGDNILF